MAIKTVLEGDPLIPENQISVGSHAGVVELDGQLDSDEERQFVLRDVWAVVGVFDVYDCMEIDARPVGAAAKKYHHR